MSLLAGSQVRDMKGPCCFSACSKSRTERPALAEFSTMNPRLLSYSTAIRSPRSSTSGRNISRGCVVLRNAPRRQNRRGSGLARRGEERATNGMRTELERNANGSFDLVQRIANGTRTKLERNRTPRSQIPDPLFIGLNRVREARVGLRLPPLTRLRRSTIFPSPAELGRGHGQRRVQGGLRSAFPASKS